MPAHTRKLFLLNAILIVCHLFFLSSTNVPGAVGSEAEPFAAARDAYAEQTQIGAEQNHTLEGTVVNSATGEPIRNALVQIPWNGIRSMLTGPDGKFKFGGLPNLTAVIQVRKPGFFSEAEAHSGNPGGFGFEMHSTSDSLPIVIKLIPEGIIYGHITGEDGEGIEGLPIQLFVRTVREGKKVVEPRNGGVTDEDGGFRIAELLPGSYVLCVGPSGNPVTFPNRVSDPGARGYPMISYPTGEDVESAAPIQITAGKRVEINIPMVLQPLYRVSGMVSGFQVGQPVSIQLRKGDGTSINANLRFDNTTGKFEVRWLATGSYVLEAQMANGQGPTFTAKVPLIVNSEVSGVRIVLAPTANVPVRMRAEYTRTNGWRPPEGQGFNLGSLTLAEQGRSPGKMQFNADVENGGSDGAMVVKNVPPGTYSVTINPNGPMYVQSATSGTLNLLEGELVVSAGGSVQPIEVVLQDDPASILGKVSVDGEFEGASVIVIRQDARSNPKIQPVNTDGSFRFHLLAPGSYTLLAVDHADGLEYANPEEMRKYSSKMKEITLSANQTAKPVLELVKIGDGE
jgi:Carboxypeptidase regulatory-like domain